MENVPKPVPPAPIPGPQRQPPGSPPCTQGKGHRDLDPNCVPGSRAPLTCCVSSRDGGARGHPQPGGVPLQPHPTCQTHVKPTAFVLQKYSVLYLLCGRKITWPGPQSFSDKARGEAGGGHRGLRSPQTARTAPRPWLGALTPAPRCTGSGWGWRGRGSKGLLPRRGTRGGNKVQEGTPPQLTPLLPHTRARGANAPPGNGATG